MTAVSIPHLLATTTARLPDATAVVDGDVTLTWRDLAAQVAAAAKSLMALGVRPGDAVMLLGPNDHRWIISSLAVHSVGAVVVPANTRYSGYELLDLIDRTDTRVLMTVDGFLKRSYLREILEAERAEGSEGKATGRLAATVEWIGTADPAAGRDGVHDWRAFLALGEQVADDAFDARRAAVTPEDVADIVFTSGTTGKSKGAISLHRQTTACAIAWAENVRLTEDDNYLIASPFAHTFGYKAGMLACVASGATMVPMSVFDPAAAMDLARGLGITVIPGPPTIFQMILDSPDRPDPGELAWRVAVTGSATVPVRLIERMYEELGLEAVVTGYGLTEAVTATMTAYQDPPERVSTSAGRAIAGFEIRIRDSQGAVLPPGTPGEVELRGPNVMVGYLDDPAATAATIDSDGWLRTGDVGVLSADGYLTITDRIKDMFTVGGFNVYPAEVEHVLSRLPGVSESTVIGVPDERLGSVGKAWVIPAPGADLTAEDVIGYLRQRLANFKVPRSVDFVSDLPRNHAGKVLKRALLEQSEKIGEVR